MKNFKAFKEAEIEVKPVTILIGPNNSGKSSLIQSILLIQQTLMGSGNSVLNTSGQKFGNFSELVNQKSDKKEIGFRLDFSDKTCIEFGVAEEEDNYLFIKDFFCKTDTFIYSLNDLDLKDYDKEYIRNQKKCTLTFDKNILKSKKILGIYAEPVFYRDSFFLKIDSVGDSSKFINDCITKLVGETTPHKYINSETIVRSLNFYNNAVKVSNDFYQEIKNNFNNIKYIGPIRHAADRSYERGSYTDVGSRGEHAVQILANDSELKDNSEKEFRNMDIADTFEISSSGGEKSFGFIVKTKIADEGINFADVGCGTSQILPIIVQSLIPHEESLIMIEQPEAHLHPKVQADLADFFVKVASENKKFLLETHSDYFIERIRYNIMTGDIPTEDVAIYYIEQNKAEKCSTIITIDINTKGQYSNLPDNYITNFRLKETRKITKKLLETL